ncbi:arylsulfatase [Halorussus salinisoli]|uniref:arylsulfatase n=1 Tax=Halorussus salinisoli TaxID=2558242 RepID=UPI002A91ED21|nr:arylsulfatase [Halorussus salinisoli]
MSRRPNILFVMTDQHRGDTIGADPECPTDDDGYSLVHTPNIDQLVGEGVLFSRAYSPAPSSIPARRCLWTGQTPATNGCTNWTTADWDFEYTLPGALRDVGYQTRLTGKTHSLPPRNHFGFEQMKLHAGLSGNDDDYSEWLERRSGGEYDEISHGTGRNSWDPRPSHLDEHEHPTNWTTNRALEFFEKRDPTRPFFHYVSYVRPHQPFDPPQAYWDMYIDRDLPEPYMGEWSEELYREHAPDYPETDAWCADLSPTTIHRARAGYYGSVTHIDHQLKRLLTKLRQMGELKDTIVVFTSDHGEMLGDHLLWRKTYAYEGSARIPLVVRFPDGWSADRGRIVDAPVGLEDLMPTFLDMVDIDSFDTVEGHSLTPLFNGDAADWRDYYHGEHGPIYHEENATQYLVGDQYKYIWNPVTGDELLFDLRADPGEETDLTDDPDHVNVCDRLRQRLVDRLATHPRDYSDGTELQPVGTD